MTTTILSPGKPARTITYRPARHPSIDCFYLYPNVTRQRGPNANLDIDPQETAIATLEASPFSQVCRVFAPMYREATGRPNPKASAIAYASVLIAWRDYLAHDNHGRGVVLIGHSEGASQLAQLVLHDIDDNASTRHLLVSAILTGANILISSDGFGPFQNISACRSQTQTGCVVAYSAFSQPPPGNSRFGRPATPTVNGIPVEVLCTNPAALAGGAGNLSSLYPTRLPVVVPGALNDGVFDNHAPKVPTAWVQLNYFFDAQCTTSDQASVLLITARTGAPPLTASPDTSFGLHIDDPNLALGNLVDLVRSQANAYIQGIAR